MSRYWLMLHGLHWDNTFPTVCHLTAAIWFSTANLGSGGTSTSMAMCKRRPSKLWSASSEKMCLCSAVERASENELSRWQNAKTSQFCRPFLVSYWDVKIGVSPKWEALFGKKKLYIFTNTVSGPLGLLCHVVIMTVSTTRRFIDLIFIDNIIYYIYIWLFLMIYDDYSVIFCLLLLDMIDMIPLYIYIEYYYIIV